MHQTWWNKSVRSTDGMLMCAIYKQWAWGSLASCNQVVQDRQTPGEWAGWLWRCWKQNHFLAARRDSEAVTIGRPSLLNRPNPACRSLLQNNMAFPRKATVTTPVSQLGRTGNIWFFSCRGGEKPQPHTSSRRESWNSQEYSEEWRKPGWVVDSGDTTHGRCASQQATLESRDYLVVVISPTPCTGMCFMSMWCPVHFTAWIVTDTGSWLFL